jgi:hypothetical protein
VTGVKMSGAGSGGGNIAGVTTVASGAVVLPFTHGNMLVSYVLMAAIACGTIIVLSKVAKNVIVRHLA